MSLKNLLSIFLLIAGIVVLDARVANACSCGSSGSVLDAYERAAVVILVTVKSVDKAEGGIGDVVGIRSTTVEVEKVFKGKLSIGDEMVFMQGGGADCIWTFSEQDIGSELLFYLNGKEDSPKFAIASTCGRSSNVKYAADDLLYLENLAKVRGKTRISGTMASYTGENLNFSGRKVRIIGEKKTYEVKTDKNGVYEIYDLAPGKYLIEPEIPLGWKLDTFYFRYSSSYIGDKDDAPARQIPIVLEKKRHAGLDLNFVVANGVRGRVYGPNGNLMEDVCLNLIPANDRNSKLYKADCTAADGTFNIGEIPPGSYLLAINKNGKITSSEPFRTFYYPNVSDPDKASVLTLAAGTFLDDIDVHVPRVEETVTIDGVLVYSDGKPAADVYVEFKAENSDDSTDGDGRAKTDKRGRFTVRVLKGLTGQLIGEMFTYSGEFENCPKVEAALRKTGSGVGPIRTTPIAIAAESNIIDVELRFAFPWCKKAEDPDK